MDTDRVRRDVGVAAVAGGVAVLVTLLLEFALGVEVSLFVRAAPLYVYALYVFTRKGGPYSRFDTARVWMGLAAVAGLGVLLVGLVG